MSAREPNEHKITEEDIATVWPSALSYLAEILNGEYSVEDARADVLGLIGSKFDELSFPSATCPDCDGHGIMHGYDADCPTCSGSGKVPLINTKVAGNG